MDRLADDADSEVFAAPGGTWQRVSPRLATARRIGLVVPHLALVAVVVLVATRVASWTWAGLALVAASAAWSWWLAGRQVAAYGWDERADDLVVVHGVLVRRLVVVPYGRMQFVDVTAGPVERRLGIAKVQLHTATPATSAEVPGLPPREAAALRDRLSALGEARAAGL